MRVRADIARRVVQVAVACVVGVAGVGLWAGPALAVQCPSRATQCQDWPKVPGRGWMQDVVCPKYRSFTVTESVRNLTENELVLAVKNIDCYDWSNTGNPSQITGRVLDAGETATYRLEMAKDTTSRYDLGVFVGDGSGADGSGLRRIGKVNAFRLSGGAMSFANWPDEDRVYYTNTGKVIHKGTMCVPQLLGEDPERTKSTVSFNTDPDVTTIYSDGTKLYAVRCALL